MRITFKMTFNTVITMPSLKGVRASPAARKAPLNMKNISMPRLKTNMIRRYGSASTWTSGAAFTIRSSPGARK